MAFCDYPSKITLFKNKGMENRAVTWLTQRADARTPGTII
jgi:hypothetical protein